MIARPCGSAAKYCPGTIRRQPVLPKVSMWTAFNCRHKGGVTINQPLSTPEEGKSKSYPTTALPFNDGGRLRTYTERGVQANDELGQHERAITSAKHRLPAAETSDGCGSYLAGFRQVLEDGDLARVRADYAVVFVSGSKTEGYQAAHDAKRRLLQD